MAEIKTWSMPDEPSLNVTAVRGIGSGNEYTRVDSGIYDGLWRCPSGGYFRWDQVLTEEGDLEKVEPASTPEVPTSQIPFVRLIKLIRDAMGDDGIEAGSGFMAGRIAKTITENPTLLRELLVEDAGAYMVRMEKQVKDLEKRIDLANREADRAVATAKTFRERLVEAVEHRNNLQLSLTDMRSKRDRAEQARDAARKERDQLREEGLKASLERTRFEMACTRLEEDYRQLSERFRLVTRALHHAQRDVHEAQSSTALGKRVRIEADLVEDIRTAVSKRDRLMVDAIQEAARRG